MLKASSLLFLKVSDYKKSDAPNPIRVELCYYDFSSPATYLGQPVLYTGTHGSAPGLAV